MTYTSNFLVSNAVNIFIHVLLIFKDARSVSLYPYNRSQIVQYCKYTKKTITLQKELQNFVINNVLLDKK